MTPRVMVSDFKPGKDGLKQVLGDLEAEIMELLWQRGQATVREVHEKLLAERELAYTTVMTVMSRLAEKDLLVREQQGQAYIYRPKLQRERFVEGIVKEVMDALLGSFGEQAYSHLVSKLSEADDERLSKLESLIQQRRRA